MKYLFCFLVFLLSFFSKSYGQDSKKVVWEVWSKNEIETMDKVDRLIYQGYYDESIVLIHSIIKKKMTSKALVSVLKLKEAKCYFITLQKKASKIKQNEALKILNDCETAQEKEVIRYEFISYYCFTNELRKADSVYTTLQSPSDSQFEFDKSYYGSLLRSKQGDFKEIFNLINDPLLTSGESMSFTTLTEDNKSTLLQKRIALNLIKANSFIGYGQYKNCDSILRSLKYEEGLPVVWYYKAQASLGLGNNFHVQGDYAKAADEYLKIISTVDFNNYSYDYLNTLYLLIENYLRACNTLDGDNYLRRLHMLSIKSSGKKEMAEVVFESAYAVSLIIKGDYTRAETHLARAMASLNEFEGHPLRIRILDLYKEIYTKSGKVKELKDLVVNYSNEVGMYCGFNTLMFHKAKLEEAKVLSIYVGEPFISVGLFKNHFDKGYALMVYTNSPEKVKYLSLYADVLKKVDQVDSSAMKLQEATKITEVNFGSESTEFLFMQAKYASALFYAGNYPLAVSLLAKLNKENEKILKGSLSVQEEFYLVMASLNQLPGDYELSKKFLSKALIVQQKRVTPDILTQAELEEKSALLYLKTNNFSKSEKALFISNTLKNKKIASTSPLYFNYNSIFAELKITTGDLANVDKYLKAASSIAANVYGEGSLTKADANTLYGEYYLAIGDYGKANELFDKADKVVVGVLGKNHLKHAELVLKKIIARSKIASFKQNDLEKLYTEAISIVTLDLGTNNPLYMDIILKQAAFYIKIAKYKEAEARLDEAERFWKNLLGSETTQAAEIDMLRGDMMYDKEDYVWATEYYGTARKIYKSVFDENNVDYANATSKLAKVHYMKNELSKSIELMDEIIPKYLDFTVRYFPSMSFRQKQKYWNSIKDEFEFYNTLALNSSKSNPEMWGKVYNNTLATKAILLSSGIKILNQVMSSQDTILVALYNDWILKKEYLLTILSLTKQQLLEQQIDRGKIEDDITRIEKEMSVRSTVFSVHDKKKKLISWENVRDVLTDGEYSVEIIRYRQFKKVFTDSVYYAAFVLHRGVNAPQMILNNNGINMERRNLKYFKNVTTTNVDDMYSYDVYWKKIKSIIPDGSVVYLSGDGVYNQINMEMLRHDANIYSIDENKFVFVSNTKDLILNETVTTKKVKEQKKVDQIDYLLCGSPDFYSVDSKISNRKIPALPGTEKEIQLINDLLVANNKNPQVYFKSFLTEDTIKLIKNPKVIHIATHGYFKESVLSDDEDLANSPLLNSGILLHSAGDILDNQEDKYINQKSGVLTAYEAMNLVLDNTDLVILSACETGRGEVQIGEGVAGLQRSFLLAGSKAIVVSLFKVNDEVTQKLMLYFYEDWLKTGNKRTAFSNAKLKIKEQYKSPIFWGAFMMIEGKPEKKVSN